MTKLIRIGRATGHIDEQSELRNEGWATPINVAVDNEVKYDLRDQEEHHQAFNRNEYLTKN